MAINFIKSLITKKTSILKYAGVFVFAFALISFVFPLDTQAQGPAPEPPPPLPIYTLTVSSTSGGSVTAPGEGDFDSDEGTEVGLVATPDDCYEFVNWTGDLCKLDNPNSASTTIIMEDDYSITANFKLKDPGPDPPPPLPIYTLTVSSTSGGSVTAPGEGDFDSDEGTEVGLVATPDSGYEFDVWTGDTSTIADVDSASTAITMSDDYSVTANFEEISGPEPPPPPPIYTLTVSSTSGGRVTAPGEGDFDYDEGTEVSLVATPDSGYEFDVWTGDTSTIADVDSASTAITMSDDYSVTANFEEISVGEYSLTISSISGGSVTEPGEGTFTYDAGQAVNLVASADSCYNFVNWTGDVETIADVNSASTTITMDNNYSISANFNFTCGGGGGLPTINYPPIADAGEDKEVDELESITLDGSNSSDPDGDPLTFEWSCEEGELSDSTIDQPEYTAPEVEEDTSFTCTLTVTDKRARRNSDSMEVLVKNIEAGEEEEEEEEEENRSPIANAGEDKEVNELEAVILDGSGSYDPDGDPITYEWLCEGGRLFITDRVRALYIALGVSSDTTFTCNLTVTDDKGLNASDSVEVLVKNVTFPVTPPVTPSVTPPVTEEEKVPTLAVEKLARNLTQNQTEWQNSILAHPSDEIEFQIKVASTGKIAVEDITIVDFLPNKMSYINDLKIDGEESEEDIINGINIGDLLSDESKIITFKAKINSKDDFSYCSAYLVNGVGVYSSNFPPVTDNLTIEVHKVIFTKAMAGIATIIGENPNLFWIGLILLIIILVLLGIYLFSRKRKQEKIKIEDIQETT